MVGIRRTDGGVGCPPTATPPSDYKNPFRVDSAGALWIQDCFRSLVYFGEARHDLTSPVAINSDSCKVSVGTDFVEGRNPITAGTYTTRTVTNTTPCTLGILLAHNMYVDMQTNTFNFVYVTLSERWNGKNHASATVSSEWRFETPHLIRKAVSSGANPHDVNAPNGGSTMQLKPGESATVACRLFLTYPFGSPQPGEVIQRAYSAVRIYGYVLG